MVLLAPTIPSHVSAGSTSNQTLRAAQAFVIARVIYLPAYAFRTTGLRSIAWSVGIVATIALYLLTL